MLTDDIPLGLMRTILLPLVDELLPAVDNDKDAAWESAEAAVMAFKPRTATEFRLAIRVALFNILGNRLTSEASAATLTPACAIRMRNCALSHIREADKAERRLEKLLEAEPKEETLPLEEEAAQAQTTPAEVKPAPTQAEQVADIPAYKRLKQERRLAKQQDRDQRLKIQAETPGAQAQGTQTPDLPLAA